MSESEQHREAMYSNKQPNEVSWTQETPQTSKIIGTFSENGPQKCSGLAVRQYSEEQLQSQLSKGFRKIRCITEDHMTPIGKTRNFLFCSFKRPT